MRNRQPTRREIVTAHHESGHAVVAHHVGHQVTDAAMFDAGDRLGRVRTIHDDADTTSEWAFKCLCVSMAGCAAGSRLCSLKGWQLDLTDSGLGDDRNVESVLRLVQLSDAQLALARRTAAHLVLMEWAAIERVAAALLQHGWLAGDEIGNIITAGRRGGSPRAVRHFQTMP